MGTTLQHGIFLPAEGERNCYTGLASNWTILDGVIGGYSSHAANLTIHVTAADKEAWNGKADASALTAHTGNTTIHVTAADKEAWNGKADASALTAHTGNTTIHVTAEDKSKWDAVTGKADDTDVLHKAGAETITGIKTFSAAPIFATFDGIRFRCAHNSNAYVTFRNADQANPGSVILSANDGTTGTAIHLVDKTLIPYTTGDIDLGTTARKWKSLNGINPGALSLPDLTAGVDISGYITNLSKGVNTYTPPANGWLSIRVKKTSLTHTSLMMYQPGGLLSSCETTDFGISGSNLPVIANKNVEIYIVADFLASAKFYPCQGNI